MKTIKVFLASSEELKNERLEFSDLVLQLNDLFEKRDLQLKLVKWEHLDSSMSKEHKQTEYNNKLKECELCLALYWTKFGDYTKEELETAYEELKAGRNPRKLYVFFKDSEELTPELTAFKESFANAYGHFFCRFENVDTMRLHFLLQLEGYQNNTTDKLLKVESQKVKVDGEEVVDLNNVPFAAFNKEYVRLRDGIAECEKNITQFRAVLATMDNPAIQTMLDEQLSKRNKMQEEFDQHQGFLFDMARKTSQLSSQRISERSAEAIRLFQEGDAAGANAVLNTEDLQRDTEQSFADYDHHTNLAEEARERIELAYKDWLLKVDAVLADENKSIEERIKEADNAYEQAVACAKKLKYNSEEQKQYAELIFDYAQFSNKYAHYGKAEELYLEHIKMCESLFGADSSEIALSYNNIGLVYNSQGNYPKALEYYRKALAIYEKVLSEEHPDTATSYNNIGLVYYHQGDYVKSEEYMSKALKIQINIFGKEHIDTAITYNNLAGVYDIQDNYAKALEYYLNALRTNEKLLGPEHLSTIANYTGIGVVYSNQENYTEALDYHFKALALDEKLLGIDHPSTATDYNNIGCVYDHKNEYDKALQYHHKALKIRERVLGVEHPDTAVSYANIGKVYKKQYNESKALEYYLQALYARKKTLGENHPDTATSYNDAGMVYYSKCDFTKALEYLFKCLAIYEKALGIWHQNTAVCYLNIAMIYYRQDNYITTLDYCYKAIAIREKILGAEHYETQKIQKKIDSTKWELIHIARNYFEIGDKFIDSGDYTKAIENFYKSLDIYKSFKVDVKIWDECNWKAAEIYNNIGYTYNIIGIYKEALSAHLKAVEINKSIYGEEEVITARSYNHIGKTYNCLGEYDIALEWLNKALVIRERELGADHESTIATLEQIEIAKSQLTN